MTYIPIVSLTNFNNFSTDFVEKLTKLPHLPIQS
jgi:hypothetical protein